MKISCRRLLIGKLFVIFVTLPSLCQSAQQLASRFRTVSAYELRPGILMLSKFDPSGQICEATIEPVAVAESVKSAPVLSERLADELTEEIVPVGVRGAPERGVYEVKMNYALMTVEKVGFYSEAPKHEAIQMVVIKWRKRECR